MPMIKCRDGALRKFKHSYYHQATRKWIMAQCLTCSTTIGKSIHTHEREMFFQHICGEPVALYIGTSNETYCHTQKQGEARKRYLANRQQRQDEILQGEK